MNCKKIINFITTVPLLVSKFDEAVKEKRLNDALELKKQLLFPEFHEAFPDLVSDFRQAVNQIPRFWLKIYQSPEEIFGNINAIPIKHQKPIQSWNYRAFLEDLKSYLNGNIFGSDENLFKFASNMNSLFLSLYIRHDKPFEIADLPDVFKINFGNYFKRGKLKIDNVFGTCFTNMSVCEVEVDKISEVAYAHTEVCTRMQSGIMRAREVEATNLCSQMSGGKAILGKVKADDFARGITGGEIIADEVESHKLFYGAMRGNAYIKELFHHPDSGLNIDPWATNMTLFIENINLPNDISHYFASNLKSTILFRNINSNSFRKNRGGRKMASDGDKNKVFYDETTGRFSNASADEPEKLSLQSSEYLIKEEMRDGLFIVDQAPNNTSPIDFRLLYGGIVVIQSVQKCRDIGKGMKGGIIVIDDPMIKSEDEARKLITGDREGGMIFYLKREIVRGKLGLKKKKTEFVLLG